MAEKSSSSSSSGIDKALWRRANHYVDLCCTKTSVCGARVVVLRAKKNASFGGRSFTWWRKVGPSSRLKVYPAWFLQSYLLSHKPQGCHDTGKVLFLDAQRQTTRQRSRTTDSARKGAPLAPSELPSDGAHFAHLHSVLSRQLKAEQKKLVVYHPRFSTKFGRADGFFFNFLYTVYVDCVSNPAARCVTVGVAVSGSCQLTNILWMYRR